MTSENETVAEVLAEFGKIIELMRKCRCVGMSLWNCLKFKLRIEAAYRREVAEMKKELDEWKSNCNFNHEDRKKKQKQIVELQEENKRLRAALKPVLKCKVLSAMTAEVRP